MEALRVANLKLDPDMPFFVAPAVCISLATLWFCSLWYRPSPQGHKPTASAALAWSVLLGLGLGAVHLGFNALELYRGHPVTLSGDIDAAAPSLFRFATSYTDLGTAAFIEESPVRGLVQLGLQYVVSPVQAELIADAEYVLFHWRRLAVPQELVLVTLTAIALGRLTAATQAIRYAVIAHWTCNITIASGVLVLRIAAAGH